MLSRDRNEKPIVIIKIRGIASRPRSFSSRGIASDGITSQRPKGYCTNNKVVGSVRNERQKQAETAPSPVKMVPVQFTEGK